MTDVSSCRFVGAADLACSVAANAFVTQNGKCDELGQCCYRAADQEEELKRERGEN